MPAHVNVSTGLESQVDAHRSDRRPVAHAEPDRVAKLAEILRSHTLEDIPGVEETDELGLPGTETRSSPFNMTVALPPIGNPFLSMVSIVCRRARGARRAVEREAANRGVAAGEEPSLAGKSSTDRIPGPSGRSLLLILSPRCRPSTMPLEPGRARNVCAVMNDFAKPTSRSDRACGELTVDAEVRARRRVDRVVARVAHHRG